MTATATPTIDDQTNAHCQAERNTETASHTSAASDAVMGSAHVRPQQDAIRPGSAACWFRRRAETIFPSALQLTLNGANRESPRWRRRQRQHAGRVRYPRTRPLSKPRQRRWIDSICPLTQASLDEFTSCNTASTTARFGDNSQTGSVFAALPVSNAA